MLRQDQPGRGEITTQPHNTSGIQSTGSELLSSLVVNSETQLTSDLDHLSRTLLSTWPNQNDLDLILGVPVSISVLFHGLICQPYSKVFSTQVISPRHMLQPPPQGSHPVLIARKLLLLGALLQGIPPRSVNKLDGLSSNYCTIMSRVFNAATRLVTNNDELVDSIEGIECIMIESMYLNNAGNLRRAWLANRRAIVLAQMMGLHTGTGSPGMILGNETRDRIHPDYMWSRLVFSDRYLSLMLGLPQASIESVLACPKALDNCTALERMERMEAEAGGLILQRNSTRRTDLAETCKIDKMLQEAAALMSPQWWVMTPDLAVIAGNDVKAFEETLRLMNHFTHHHLLVHLHLPYMMLPSSIESTYDYNKMTATNASRAIIALFVSFRKSFAATAYCRGIDFIAFIASTTLCLAHIQARRQQKIHSGKDPNVFQSLQHQRLSDRGLLERTLEVMQTLAESNGDVVAQKISSILEPLLAIEKNSFRGGCYHIRASSEVDERESQCIGDPSEGSHTLHIQIPYFGTIQIEDRSTLSNNIEAAQTDSAVWNWNPSVSQAVDDGLVFVCDSASSLSRDDQRDLVSGPRSAGYEISTAQPVNSDWQTVPSYLDSMESVEQSGSANCDQRGSSIDMGRAQETYLLVPGLEADINDWALQGVDLALFNNLAQASADSSESRSRTNV